MAVRRSWSTNQAALRFFTATLLYVDVLSSVTLGSVPRLYRHQASIIPGCPVEERAADSVGAGPLFLDEFFGLKNWVIQALGNVAALESWKRLQKQTGSLSVKELVSRGQVLGDAIKGGLEVFENKPAATLAPTTAFPMLVADPVTGDDADEQPLFQIIWLLATPSYLNVVLSGLQPASPEIRWPVAKVTVLLSQIPRGSMLRSLAWLFCVCGCLSPPEDEDAYRATALRMSALQVFGTVKEAMKIMEEVWSMKGQMDGSWDVSKCLNVLGHGVLLIRYPGCLSSRLLLAICLDKLDGIHKDVRRLISRTW